MNFQYPDSLRRVHAVPGRRGGGRRRAAPAPRRRRRIRTAPPGMENGFEKDFAVVWPAPGIGDMQGGIGRTRMPAQNLNHFTADDRSRRSSAATRCRRT